MKIRLIGQSNLLGGGIHYFNFSEALKKIHHIGSLVENIDTSNVVELNQAIQTSQENDVNIWFWQDKNIVNFKGKNVVWAIFESDKLPEYYINFFNQNVDLIWVPSSWGRDILIKNGVNSGLVDIVPEGVDSNLFHPFLRTSLDKTGEPFRFLTIGKYEQRKGYLELLRAFKEAFNNSMDVELVIKADYFLDSENKKNALIDQIGLLNLKNVRLIWGRLSNVQLAELYTFADAFVSSSKAEGWGLPLIEAASSGLPIVATFYSGQTEFLQHIESSIIKIQYELEQICDDEFIRYWPAENGNYGCWAQPSISSIRDGMLKVVLNRDTLNQKAYHNALIIKSTFNWEKSINVALKSISLSLAVKYT